MQNINNNQPNQSRFAYRNSTPKFLEGLDAIHWNSTDK